MAVPAEETCLHELTLEGVARFIKNSNVRNIITMAGAGLSTNAGIPDFRSPDSGLYNKLAKYNLPHPMAIFTIDYFQVNPKPFFALSKELYPGSFKPTSAHYFLRILHEEGLLLRHYTQNVDGLEKIAGLPADKVVDAHGTYFTSHCTKCGKEYDLPTMKKAIFADEVPTCSAGSCKGVIKPDVVLYGENLPNRFSTCVFQDFKQCDLLIIMGTSLAVMPFASLLERVGKSVPRLYINKSYQGTEQDDEEAGVLHRLASLFSCASGGLRWGKSDNVRDVFVQDDCDSACAKMAAYLDWTDKLDSLVKRENEKLDALLKDKQDLAELYVTGKL